ncbi:hypothetical protein XU18_5199 [Perkinsela sp. CCAP 1560/4]|nr:hypothetical protein XU18_5199 [Perkinsela sp. CCAP 1560/4]|eukprot:KNH01410.1 hypothetical protein XU18_5199 [Perkinsela sp. CCAP 1560/4]
MTELSWVRCGELGLHVKFACCTLKLCFYKSFGKSVFIDFADYFSSVDFAGFPSTLSTLNLSSNHLCGTIDMSRVHHSFCKLLLNDNAFEGEARLSSEAQLTQQVNLKDNCLEKIVDTQGKEILNIQL